MQNNKTIRLDVSNYKNYLLFYGLSTIIPWSFWFLGGYISYIEPYQDKNLDIAIILALIGLLAPMVVAFALIGKNAELRRDVASRFFNFGEIKPIYLILSVGIMPASIILAQAVSLLFGYSPSQFSITSDFTFSSGILPVWVLLIVAPTIEELAWHTYGTDCLMNRFSLFKASIIFAVFWGLWHIPLSSIRDYYQNVVMDSGWIHSVNFLVSIIPFVLIMNWLYYKAARNIIVPIVFHITAGFFNEIFSTHPDSKVIQTVLLFVLSGYIVIKNKDLFFSHDNSVG